MYGFCWQVSLLNRYGNQTETTGVLNFRWYIITQREARMADRKAVSHGKSKQTNRRHTAITNVLDAYREARERLEDIIKPI